jgi:hypothetical protein
MKNFSTEKYVLFSTLLVGVLTGLSLFLFGNWINDFTINQSEIFNIFNFGGITITYLCGLLIVVGFFQSEVLLKLFVVLSYYITPFWLFDKLSIPKLGKTKSSSIKKFVFNLHKEFGKAGVTKKSFFYSLQPAQFEIGEVYNLNTISDCFDTALAKTFAKDPDTCNEILEISRNVVFRKTFIVSVHQSTSNLIDSESIEGIKLLLLIKLGYRVNHEQFKKLFNVLIKFIDLDKYLCHSSFGIEDLDELQSLVFDFTDPLGDANLILIFDTFYDEIQKLQNSAQVNFYFNLRNFLGGN